MASQVSGEEDFLVSALPPATDYMTYLTMLEYQLTPQNLPMLSRLLSDDDGKLAEEIGWDLLKLILPMLKDNAGEGNRCLEIVARRGNPREVVVRVAEELEKLGDQADYIDEVDFEDDQDELPTFPGEAPHVHLGHMTLDGMPNVKEPGELAADDSDQPSASQQSSIKLLQLQSLFNMLSILHPRIKTQFPSRFLATSLPAALGAYRQMTITTATTSAFLSMLEKLTDNKRPALPPRANTTDYAGRTSVTTAPLLDAEDKADEKHSGVSIPFEAEQAINFKLLNAVLLEVLDEYLSSLATMDYPSMSWTARLREYLEPKRVVPGRPTEIEQWKQVPELAERDTLLARFFSISQELQVDTSHEIRKLLGEDEDDASGNPYHEDEPSEYPTTPSQIPFPRAGVIYLHAYHSYNDHSDTTILLTITELTRLIAHSFPLSATPSMPLPALQDALLSLLYRQSLAVAAAPTTPQPSPAKFVLLLSTLTQLFTITPYPNLRDSAHHIATKLLHVYPDPQVRIRLITQALKGSTLSTNWAEIEDEGINTPQPPEPEIVEQTGLTRSTSALVPHPIPLAPPQQLGQLKSIAVDWLKEEFLLQIALKARMSAEEPAKVLVGGLDPAEVLITSEGLAPGGDQSSGRPLLVDLLFPSDLPALPPSTIALSSATTDEESSDRDAVPNFLLSIPFYISTLNLTCIVLPHLHSSESVLKSRIAAHLESLDRSSRFLIEVLRSAQAQAQAAEGSELEGGGDQNEGVLEDSRADIFALEDACARAKTVGDRFVKE